MKIKGKRREYEVFYRKEFYSIFGRSIIVEKRKFPFSFLKKTLWVGEQKTYPENLLKHQVEKWFQKTVDDYEIFLDSWEK